MPKTQNNRGGSRRANNNNPEGRNQYNSGWVGMARERPATAAAMAAGAVATGVFLWSKRGQISEQLSQISDQLGEWTENMTSERREFETVGDDFSSGTSGSSSNRSSGNSRSTGGARGGSSSGAGSIGGSTGEPTVG